MGNTYRGPEKRRCPRVKAAFVVTFGVNRPMEVRMLIGNKEIDAVMLDLSKLGMAIVTNYDIPTETIIFMKFTLINPFVKKNERVKSMEVTGEVRNNTLLKKKKHRMGIFFTQISQKEKNAIASFVNSAIKHSYWSQGI